MKKIFFALVALLLSDSDGIKAQSLPPIQLDRPDQTECPFITPVHYIQMENGFNLENTDKNSRSFVYPTSLIKYGINEKFELRFIAEYMTLQNAGKKQSGLMPLTLGFKTALMEEKGIIPKTSFIGHITTSKAGSKEFQTPYIAPSFRFTMQHTISKKMVLAYNLGAEWNGIDPDETYIYTLTTGFSLTERLGCYTELYGFIRPYLNPDHRCDGGFTYLVNQNFMMDISGGFRLTENAPRNYISLGLSYRFKVGKSK
jgi:hypothetical protein